jgi:dihydrofolate reductase
MIVNTLHRWMFEEPEANAAETQGVTAAGASIMGRNMFGPGRDGWDLQWTGWWGDEPPYHGPVFVQTPSAPDAAHERWHVATASLLIWLGG